MVQQSALSRALMRMEKENYVRRVLRWKMPAASRYIHGQGADAVQFVEYRRAAPRATRCSGFSAAPTAAFATIRRLSRNMRSRS